MTKQSLTIVFICLFGLFINGCDSGTQTTQNQDVVEIKWQSDGSAIFGFIQAYASTINSTQPSIAYNIARFNADGSLAQNYNTNGFASRPTDPNTGQVESFAPAIYLSSDGSTLVAQLENDLYRYNTKTNFLTKLQTLFHLIYASSDLKYVIGTPSPANQPIKTIQVYDISVSPIRLVTHFDVSGATTSPGIWLNNGTFGISCTDSIGDHISIFDTASIGIPISVIDGAETQFHNTVFNPQTNDLYVRNHAGKTTDYYVAKINLSSMTRTNLVNFSVDNFDISSDEQILIYSASDSVNSTTNGTSIRARNLQTLKEQTLATDNLRFIQLSPAQNKLAYISGTFSFNQIRVIPFSRP